MNDKRRGMRFISFSAAAACLLGSLNIAPFEIIEVSAADKSAFTITQEMKIGWNLGNTLDSYSDTASGLDTETCWGNPKTTKAMIDAVKAKGFNTVRVPTTWFQHLDGSNNIDSAWMARVKEVVDYAIDNDMYVILNLHHENWIDRPDLGSAYDEMKPKFIKVWTQIATAFKDYDQHLIFESMNEPRAKGTDHEWWGPQQSEVDTINRLNADFVNTVRSIDSPYRDSRLLMIPGYCASSDATMISQISVPQDNFVAVSIHAYVPYDFTMNTAVGDHSTFTESYSASLQQTLDNIRSTFISKNIPVVIGEFGTSNFNNTDARVKWAEAYISTTKSYGIPCVLWDNNVISNPSGAGECHGYLNRSSLTWYSESEPVVNKMMEVLGISSTNAPAPSSGTQIQYTEPAANNNSGTSAAQSTGSGFHVSGQKILDANGNEFIMRGINVAHTWYQGYTEQTLKAAAAKGCNTVRVVCADGGQWSKTSASEIQQIIGWCKENKLVCVLEAHDATGSDNISDVVAAANYWAEMKDILNANKDYVILNIANEWVGTWDSSTWSQGNQQAIKIVRDAGIKNMIMIDAAGWGQYANAVKEQGKNVFNSDPDKNTVFSIHFYGTAGKDAGTIKNNIDGALSSGAPVLAGEFGYNHSDGDVDEAYLMSYCDEKGLGYLAWSWKGNGGGVEYLDLVNDWDGNSLTEWGQIFFSTMKGSKPASVYTGGTPAAQAPVQQTTQAPVQQATQAPAQQTQTPSQSTGSGFHVSGQKILDANGNEFIMRGINVAHTWYQGYTEQTLKAAAAKGCNTVRVVCADGGQWSKTSASEIQQIIGWCKENKLVCVLEAHDATGSDNISDVVAAANYWAEMKDILNANKDYVILNIANEWVGTWDSSTWSQGNQQAIKIVRDAGIKNMIMIDAAGWGQYANAIKEQGKNVFNSDPDKNTVFSIHFYGTAGKDAGTIKNNIDGALSSGAPVLAGEFGYNHSDGDVDEAYLMSYCDEKGLGYLAWSWKGNGGGVEYLDLVNDWDGNSLTEWGQIFFNAMKGSKPASVYTGGTSSQSSSQTPVQQTTQAPTNAPAQTPVMLGDANCDNMINVADAVAILQFVANQSKYPLGEQGTRNADCDGVSGITGNDAIAVQKYDAGIIKSFS